MMNRVGSSHTDQLDFLLTYFTGIDLVLIRDDLKRLKEV